MISKCCFIIPPSPTTLLTSSTKYIYNDVVVNIMHTQTTGMKILVTQEFDDVYVEYAFSVVGNMSEGVQAENEETKFLEHAYT